MLDVFVFDKEVRKGSVHDLSKRGKARIWVDATDLTKVDAEILRTSFNLHPLTADDLYGARVRVKVEEFKDYIFCVFYASQKLRSVDLIEIDFVLGEDFIITTHKRPIESYTLLKQDSQKVNELFMKGPDFIFHHLIDKEVDSYFPLLENIEKLIDSVEEEIVKSPHPRLMSRILELKRSIAAIKRITLPQREKLSFLTKNEYSFISKKSLPYFRDVYDHSIRLSDTVDAAREAASNVFDVYMSMVSHNMNEVMKLLSIIATIVLPLTVISGIYGTNFVVLPGAAHRYGFWGMITAMAALSITMLYFFRKRGWL